MHMECMEAVPVLIAVRPLKNHRAWLVYADGVQGIVELDPFLQGPAFEHVKTNPWLFDNIGISSIGSLTWPDGTDIEPVRMYKATRAANAVIPPPEFSKQLRELEDNAYYETEPALLR